MNKQDYIDGAESALLHTYNRFPLVIDHGDGVYLYDTDGKEYLDFAAGIAVQAFGYNNKEYNDALKAQIDKVMHTSNLYYNVPIMNAAKRLLKASRMDRVFFTNSGTEAIEGAIKAAKKYAYTRDGHAAALDIGNDVKLALGLRYAERLVDDELQRIETEIVVDVAVVDRNRTAAGINADTCNGLLSSAGSVEIRLCAFVHNSLSVLSLS